MGNYENDSNGKWEVEDGVRILVEPSTEYIETKNQENATAQSPIIVDVGELQTKSTQHNTQLGQLLLKSAKKDIENTTLKKQNADILLRMARNNLI